MAISYSSGTNTITITGYSEATPCNFTDIYNADVSGSWGKVTLQCTNQFCFGCKIIIGDGSTATWFADIEKQSSFQNILTSHWQTFIHVKNNAHFYMGIVTDTTEKTTKSGCAFLYVEQAEIMFGLVSGDVNADIKLYGCQFICINTGTYTGYVSPTNANNRIWNCIFEGGCCVRGGVSSVPSSGDFYNNLIQDAFAGFTQATGVNDRAYITDCRHGFHFTDNHGGDMSNAIIINPTESDFNLNNVQVDRHALNVVCSWLFKWGITNTHKVYRQYEFDLKVVDSAGTGIDTAKVKAWDAGNALVTNATTNASGVLATQTLNYGYYNQAGGQTPVMQTPHEMRIYEYGKSMLSSKSSIEAKTDWALTMLTDPYITQTTEATVAAYTGITINHTTETITISSNHTLDEIYDYCQYDMIASTKQLDQTTRTTDGVNFVSEYSFIVNTGITVTATDQKLSMVSGESYTLWAGAQFTGIIATTTTTRIPVKLTNIIDGSRYWVGKSSDGSEIFKGTQSGSGTVTGYYEHTADIDIDIRVRKSSASVKYLPWVGDGTLIASAFSLRIKQIQDNIVT